MLSKIRPADLSRDRGPLADLLSRQLAPDAGNASRFTWLYERNPHGPAYAWVAVEENTGEFVGAASAFPRRLRVAGGLRQGFVLGDFCIDSRYRSLGLALQLQRACLEPISAASGALGYDFPSDRMMAIYRRMQIVPHGRMIRWVKPLRVDRKLAQLVKSAALARILAAPANEILRRQMVRASSRQVPWTLAEHAGACGPEFSALADTVGARYGSCVARSAEYLNWRYRDHPFRSFEIVAARRAAELAGYIVFSHAGQDASIVDSLAFDDAHLWAALLAHTLELLRRRGVVTVTMGAATAHPWAGLLESFGFRPRESGPIVVYDPARIATSDDAKPSPWFIMDGDRES